ncbi:MAG: spore coat protein CotJB [Clostridia bacterium]|nr:spore coat protein CotJB [Clostridia bacterium]
MFYPKADCCPFSYDEQKKKILSDSSAAEEKETELCVENQAYVSSRCEMMRRIQELDFAIIDLNLFLDTHPESAEAIELFKELAATCKSLKNDYQAKYGPLYVHNSSNDSFFDWVEKCEKWPWEKASC